MPRPFLNASEPYPVTLPDGEQHKKTVHLNRVIDHPNFQIGDFSYYSDFDEITDYASHIAPYLFQGSAECLIIGRFCQIAHGAKFITASANHPANGFSTYPFSIFNPETMGDYSDLALQWGDTIVGNDVWIGYGATILPGAKIGDGAIIGAKAVVGGRVPPYHIVAGNPAQVVRERFTTDVVERLLDIRWWDWPVEAIQRHREAIEGCNIDSLTDAARELGVK